MNINIRKQVAISNEGLIFNPQTGESFTVNPMGMEILDLIRERKTMAQIVLLILDKYEADRETLERDYLDFASFLVSSQLADIVL
jgi:hypothetical protein